MEEIISKQKLNLLIGSIKKKKELSGLNKNILIGELKRFALKNPKLIEELNKRDALRLEKSAIFKKIVKEIRRTFHKSYGLFQQKSKSSKWKLLEELRESQDKLDMAVHSKLLSANLSAKERLRFYEEAYGWIFSITSEPKRILDLGSGLNPISFPFMGLKKVAYIAIEISEEDLEFIREYFKIMEPAGLSGRALFLDLNNPSSLNVLKGMKQSDICFAFKLFDSLSLSKKNKFKAAEDIIRSLNCDWIVASFATKTVTGKVMRFKQRGWFEKMLQRIGLEYSTLKVPNETFYLIKKENSNL